MTSSGLYCQTHLGGGYRCGKPIKHTVINKQGREVWASECSLCARKALGLCRLCPRPRQRTPLDRNRYCAACAKAERKIVDSPERLAQRNAWMKRYHKRQKHNPVYAAQRKAIAQKSYAKLKQDPVRYQARLARLRHQQRLRLADPERRARFNQKRRARHVVK